MKLQDILTLALTKRAKKVIIRKDCVIKYDLADFVIQAILTNNICYSKLIADIQSNTEDFTDVSFLL